MADSDTGQIEVELVAADRTEWSGQATMEIARTTEGDVGVLRNHAPLLSLLVDGVVEITPVEGDGLVAAVDGGFLSVANNRVSILAEHAVLGHEIDVEREHAALEAAQAEDSSRRRSTSRYAAPRHDSAPAEQAKFTERGSDARVAVAARRGRCRAGSGPALRRSPSIIRRRRALAPRRHVRAQSPRSGPAKPGTRLASRACGRYSGDALEWFRVLLALAPAQAVWQRVELTFAGSVSPAGVEQMSLYPRPRRGPLRDARGPRLELGDGARRR